MNPLFNLKGKIIGTHDGATFYTIGQRKGIGIKGSLPGEHGKIYYVAAKDLKTNTIFVAEGKDENLFSDKLTVKNISWISNKAPKLPLKCLARIRYRQPLQKAKLFMKSEGLYIVFNEPQRGITPGQFAAWYENDELIGSGVIMS